MRSISVIGTGYVGLVTGTCLAEFGLNVYCMDVDSSKINMLKECKLPIYEPGLESLVKSNMNAGRLHFTTDIKEAVTKSETIFIAVGTPPQEDGSADMHYVISAARSIAEQMDGYRVIVDKSTVPVGTGQRVKAIIQETLDHRGVSYPFDVVSNPEFLREGSAVKDFTHPDRIVVGCESEKAKDIMENIYRVLYINNHPFVFTNIETAELIKYASNSFLAAKIAFINEMSILCEKVGANVNDVARAMGLDNRIGRFFLHAGPGFGGSCFPKDTKALLTISREHDSKSDIIDAVIKANEKQKLHMVEKIDDALGGNLKGKTIAVLGLAFKPETDDIRESSAIVIVKKLLENGAIVRAYDPIAMENSIKFAFAKDEIHYAKNEYDAAEGADALVIVTEWNQFRSLDIDELKSKMKGRHFFDLRNIYERNYIEGNGFCYYGVGR